MECSTYYSFFFNQTVKFLLIFIIIFYGQNRRGTGSASQIYMCMLTPPQKKKILFLILVIKTQWIHVCSITWLLGVIYSNFEQVPSPVGNIFFFAESSVYLRNHTSFVRCCTLWLTNNELEHKLLWGLIFFFNSLVIHRNFYWMRNDMYFDISIFEIEFSILLSV